MWMKVGPSFMPDRDLERLACREIVDEDDELGPMAVNDVQRVLDHPNLVRLVEHDGFATQDTRKETAWEHCDAGTLNRLILAHKGDALPESLIWHTIQSSLFAVLHLSSGRRYPDPAPEPVAGWKPMLHNLINPANIFYCHPRKYEGYKEPTYGDCKLGNFSSCLVLAKDQYSVSLSTMYEKDIHGEITGYEAPERSSYYPDARLYGSASDIWSIGACAVAMMTGQPIWHLVMRENINARMMSRRNSDWQKVVPSDRFERLAAMCNETRGSTKFRDALPLTYSVTLKRFVEALIDPNPFGRPDIETACHYVVAAYAGMRIDAQGTDLEEEYVFEDEPEEGEYIMWNLYSS